MKNGFTLAMALMAATALTAPALAAPSGDLRVAIGSDATTLNPQHTDIAVANAITLSVFEGLFRVSPEGKIVPELAEEYSWSDDGLVLTVKIKTGHTFSNGDPLDAAAVVASFGRLTDTTTGSTFAELYQALGEVVAVSDDTIEFRMPAKNGHVLLLLSNTAAMIVNARAAEEMGADFGRYPVGSGPYVVDEVISGELIRLVPNERYVGDREATLESITLTTVPEDGSRMALLETGEVDIVERVPSEMIPTIEALDNAHVELRDSMFSINLEVVLRGPFADPKVRKALALSLDREGMIQGILGGLATPSVGMIGPGTQDELRAEFDPIPFDPEAAKALLAEAGYAPGELSVNLTCPNGRFIKDTQVCQAIVAQWQAIGVDATANVMDLANWSATVFAQADKRTDDMGMAGRATAGMDFSLRKLFHSEATTNRILYANPEVDSLLAEGAVTTDLEAQKEIYGKIQEIIWNDMPYIYLWYQKQAVGVSDDVQGFTVKPNETMMFDNTTLER